MFDAPTPAPPPDPDSYALSRDDHYKVLIEDARALGERRDRMNDFFLGLVTLALGAQGYLIYFAKDRDIRASIYVVAISAFGIYLTRVWNRVIANYKALLNFRYHVLKQWEQAWFPSDQRYYVSEDALYDQKLRDAPPTPLVASYISKLPTIGFFVDIYKLLPRAALFAFILLGVARAVLALAPYVASLGLTWPR